MLNLETQSIKYRSLDEWFLSDQGTRVAQAFAYELQHFRSLIMGNTLLQLGYCGDNLWLSSLRFRHKWIVTPYFELQKTTFSAPMDELPLERNSVNCVIAPLAMEAFSKAKNPLNEMDRVLKPMGYLIILGVNPISCWGASLKWGHLACFGRAKSTLMSSFTIKRDLMHHGYVQCAHLGFYYIPPIFHGRLLKTMAFFNEMGKMLWPFPAGFYCLILQKREPGQSPIIPMSKAVDYSPA